MAISPRPGPALLQLRVATHSAERVSVGAWFATAVTLVSASVVKVMRARTDGYNKARDCDSRYRGPASPKSIIRERKHG